MSETKCGGEKNWEFEGFAPEIFLNKKKNMTRSSTSVLFPTALRNLWSQLLNVKGRELSAP